MTIHVDNASCIHVATNPDVNKRSKHIDIHYHFVKEQVALKNIAMQWIRSKHNVADLMTNPLQPVSSRLLHTPVAHLDSYT